MSALDAYLARLGIEDRPPPSIETLREVHRRHVTTVPYENLGIILGRPPSVDPRASLTRVGESGRAGYCFHHNGAIEAALQDLGFSVERRHGHVWFLDENRYDEELTHLALVVTGLPTPDNPDGRWWVDVGLGDAFLEPLPLVEGEHEEAGFRFRMEGLTPASWSFFHDPGARSFTGIELTSRTVDTAAVDTAHTRLSTPPDGMFTGGFIAQLRDQQGTASLRGCRLLRTEPGRREEIVLASYDEWRSALADVVRVRVQASEEVQLPGLYDRLWSAHLEREAERA